MTISKTLEQVEDLFKSVAKLLLGIPATDGKAVRIPYGASSETGSAPTHNPKDSVCYVDVRPTDDGYGKQHHITYINGATDSDGMTEVDDYTEEYAVLFSCYGQDGYESARTIRDGLFGIAAHKLLVKEHMHLKTDIPPIARVRELINTQWVQRCDVAATFYAHAHVERENAVLNIENVSITLKTKDKSLSYGARDRE